jgi:Uma2 family endonuclease
VETTPTAPVLSVEKGQTLKMTYAEYLAWTDEDTHAEWVNGEVIVHMPPKTRHQDVTAFLMALLRFFAQFFQLGTILSAPYEMKLRPDGPSREPDILFVARENEVRFSDWRLEGPADLVVELVSDDSVSRDRADKFYEYQDAGVREYWLIDPRPGKERADFWVLDDTGRYQTVLPDEDRIYRSTVLPGFWLRIDWLRAEKLPDLPQVFGEIVGFSPQMLDELRRLAERGASGSTT